MKKIRLVLAMVFALFSGIVAARADTNESLGNLPTSSVNEMTLYSISNVTYVCVNIGSVLGLGPNAYMTALVNKPSVAVMLQTINSQSLGIDVKNPCDPLYSSVYAFDKDWNYLIYGSHSFYLGKDPTGEYFLPAGYGALELDLWNKSCFIPAPGVNNVQIDILGSNGQSSSFYTLTVVPGVGFYIPEQLAGTNAILTAWVTDSSGWRELSWTVKDGASITSQHFDVQQKSSMAGFQTFEDSNVIVTVPSVNGLGREVWAELTSSKSQSVRVSFCTSETKWFKGLVVREAGTTNRMECVPVYDGASKQWRADIPVHKAVYYLIPAFDPQDFSTPQDPWYPPYIYGDGEKG